MIYAVLYLVMALIAGFTYLVYKNYVGAEIDGFVIFETTVVAMGWFLAIPFCILLALFWLMNKLARTVSRRIRQNGY